MCQVMAFAADLRQQDSKITGITAQLGDSMRLNAELRGQVGAAGVVRILYCTCGFTAVEGEVDDKMMIEQRLAAHRDTCMQLAYMYVA